MYTGQRSLEKSLDENLYPYIVPLLFEDYRFLVPTSRARQREDFLRGSITEPRFTYRRLKTMNFNLLRERQAKVAERVESHENRLVRDVYREKLAEIDAKISLLEAAHVGDDLAFFDASVRLYGEPRRDIYQYTLRAIKKKCEAVSNHFTDSRVHEAVQCLERFYAPVARDETFSWEGVPIIKSQAEFDEKAILTATRIQELCQETLDALEIPDWQVRISGAGGPTIFDTDHSSKTIYVPRDKDLVSRKKPMTEKRARALIAHEVETHVARRSNGERSPLKLLGMGLSHYLRGEEGIATFREQRILGMHDFSGEAQYLAISFAYGLSGKPKSFRQTWEIMRAYALVSMLHDAITEKRILASEAILLKASIHGWLHCLRAFRGTTGGTPGAIFTKDIVYREGNIAIWELVMRLPSAEKSFGVGKHDPTNKDHVRALITLGLLSEN